APEIAQDPKAPMFLITTRSENDVESGMGWSSWGLALLALLFVGLGVFFARIRGERIPVPDLIIGGVGFLLAWLLGWVWTVYNSLIELRQRVRRAGWLNEVQLKRRHDFILVLKATLQ